MTLPIELDIITDASSSYLTIMGQDMFRWKLSIEYAQFLKVHVQS
jgi:hypothetical protein